MLPESLSLLFVCALLIWVLVAFVRESWSPDIVVAIAVAVLLATQLLTPGEVLGVLSNSAPVTIACMFIISAALERTRSEEHTSALQSLMPISYAVFCLNQKTSLSL